MPVSPPAVRSACAAVEAALRSDRRYAHTSAVRVVVDGAVVHAAHYRGPVGWVRRVAEAPRIEPAGRTFRCDNGAAHLLSAALAGALGEGAGGGRTGPPAPRPGPSPPARARVAVTPVQVARPSSRPGG